MPSDRGKIVFKTANEFIGKDTCNYFLLIHFMVNILKLSISDNMIGINSNNSENIFHQFFTTKEKGTGIGLTEVYNTVKYHNGDITVESEVGKGTTFHILLPTLQKKDIFFKMFYHMSTVVLVEII